MTGSCDFVGGVAPHERLLVQSCDGPSRAHLKPKMPPDSDRHARRTSASGGGHSSRCKTRDPWSTTVVRMKALLGGIIASLFSTPALAC
jgi:hypothetical protein